MAVHVVLEESGGCTRGARGGSHVPLGHVRVLPPPPPPRGHLTQQPRCGEVMSEVCSGVACFIRLLLLLVPVCVENANE